MPLLILLVLLAVPYLEFLVFLEVGNAIGGFQALLLTILTAVIGVYLIRQQGLIVMNRMHQALQRGESPVEDIFHGFFLLIAGLFFLLPGFITDTVALLLAIEPVRAMLGKIIIKNIRTTFYKGPRSKGIIIDGEYEETPDNPKNIDHDDR
ncbi:MAG: FxsA family protein [Emcibacter sp.]|nr:FxsA family protein [Emcibacter sp.]HEC00687.1 FxsA family protein [Sphingomonadales bacterium]